MRPSPAALLLAGTLLLQLIGDRFDPWTPPPRPPRALPEPGATITIDEGLVIRSDRPWGLPPDLAEALARRADAYRDFATRFTSDETVRTATYDETGEASKETTRRYAYLLERTGEVPGVRELRQRLDEAGAPRGGEVDDEEVFPPAYAWVFLFSRFHQPYFAYRDLGEQMEGFHWVRRIQFRGALPFTDGKDIRQWEGVVLVDAAASTPVSVLAQPSAQSERLAALFDRWSQAFNLIGMHLAPRPFGYLCRVEFRLVREGLTFPTELRYDTVRAVGRSSAVRVSASTRTYAGYRFFKTGTEETIEPPEP